MVLGCIQGKEEVGIMGERVGFQISKYKRLILSTM